MVTDVEADLAEYDLALDRLAVWANSTAQAQNFTLSFYGNLTTAMNWGYTAGDVDECCLNWPQSNAWWVETTHLSTNDCLYQNAGGLLTEDGIMTLLGTEILLLHRGGGPRRRSRLDDVLAMAVRQKRHTVHRLQLRRGLFRVRW